MFLDLLLRSNLIQQEFSRMNNKSLSLLDKTVQVTPQVKRMLDGYLGREVTRDDPEWAAAMASLTVCDKVKIKPSRRQHKENERDCRTIVQQLVSSIPNNVYKAKQNVSVDAEGILFQVHDRLGQISSTGDGNLQ